MAAEAQWPSVSVNLLTAELLAASAEKAEAKELKTIAADKQTEINFLTFILPPFLLIGITLFCKCRRPDIKNTIQLQSHFHSRKNAKKIRRPIAPLLNSEFYPSFYHMSIIKRFKSLFIQSITFFQQINYQNLLINLHHLEIKDFGCIAVSPYYEL
jgi:hypothetical protein